MSQPEFLLFLGRFHPVVLHLPIGFLVLAFLLEVGIRWRKLGLAPLRPAVGFTLGLGAATAALSALLGYFLSLEGGYDEQMLTEHRNLGIALTLLSAAMFALYRFLQKRPGTKLKVAYLPGLATLMLLLIVASHHGGNLTHGSDYLLQYAPQPLRSLAGAAPLAPASAIASLEEARVYKDLIHPIFEKNCQSCHNPAKAKGDFLMDTPENLLKGGKEGASLSPGDPDHSRLYQRIILPEADDKHMPPKGKRQLSAQQVELLSWWIAQGAPFEDSVKVASLTMPESIQAILESLTQKDEGVFALKVKPAGEDDLEALRDQGFWVLPVAQDQPFLEARLTRTGTLADAQLKALHKVADQLIYLDLGGSPLQDAQVALLGKLPHLVRLRLDQTGIGDEGLAALGNPPYLESLNLFGTAVTDEGLKSLEGLQRLRALYLWQTPTTAEGIAALQAALPELEAYQGTEVDEVFGSARLAAPLIQSDNTLFLDETEVELVLDFGGVELFYTLDGSEPSDSTGIKYEAPIELNASATVKAVAFKEGWESSEVAEKDFIKLANRLAGLTLEYPPADKYKGKGPLTLVDLQKGSQVYSEDAWLGFEAKDLVGTFDLGEGKEIRRVTASCLEDVNAWIFYPTGIQVETSMDGKSFQKQGTQKWAAAAEPTSPSRKHFSLTFTPTQARYVRVTVQNIRKNPDWHPVPGGDSWLFVDEVMIE